LSLDQDDTEQATVSLTNATSVNVTPEELRAKLSGLVAAGAAHHSRP
jgi:uncharacterized protein YgfB (UPF0149 family)